MFVSATVLFRDVFCCRLDFLLKIHECLVSGCPEICAGPVSPNGSILGHVLFGSGETKFKISRFRNVHMYYVLLLLSCKFVWFPKHLMTYCTFT